MEHHTTSFAAGIICIWLSFWAIRRTSEADYRLDWTSHAVRWAVVVLGFAVAQIPGPNLGYLRVAGYILGLAFLSWPNFAHHLVHLARKMT